MAVVRVSAQAMHFHGIVKSYAHYLLPVSTFRYTCFGRISAAGYHSSSATPKSNSNCDDDAILSTGMELRPGMVLLKGFLTLKEQVTLMRKIKSVRSCGFEMWFWDPEKKKYPQQRLTYDDHPPFKMPHEFIAEVIRALAAAQSLTQTKHAAATNVQDILPTMSPDHCVFRFHAPRVLRPPSYLDREDSERYESLADGLPIVSFSLGDTGEFFYGDCRDTSEAKMMILESGDVLVFGGLSRLIFQSEGSVFEGTAPKGLFSKSGVDPGRYSLSFREF